MALEFCAICRGGVQVYRITDGTGAKCSVGVAASTTPPPLHTAVNKVKEWNGAESAVWSSDGEMLALAFQKEIQIFTGPNLTEQLLCFELSDQIKQIQFSPLATYLLSCTRGGSGSQPDPLVQLWSIATSREVFATSIKSFARQWPLFVWTDDESLAFQIGHNGVRIFDAKCDNYTTPIAVIPINGLVSCVPSPSAADSDSSCLLAVFTRTQNPTPQSSGTTTTGNETTPQAQDLCSAVKIYDLTHLKSARGPSECNLSAILGTVPLGKANIAKIMWCKSGKSILIDAVFEHDDAHRFYEGSNVLYIYRVNQKGNGPRHKEVVPRDAGPVHDVAWSPVYDEFALSCGSMPPHLTLNHGVTGNGKVSFGKARRNTIRFDPFGNLIAFGGFGNLPGDLDVWDRNKGECISSTQVPCAIQVEWAPDGRHLLASTTTPRLRVDNAVKILHYSGALRAKIDFDVLYSAVWRPVKPDIFISRPITPGRCQSRSPTKEVITGGTDTAGTPYRPPGCSGVLAAAMRAERSREKQQTAKALNPVAKPKANSPQSRLPPGARPAAPKPKTKKKPF